MLCSVSFSLYYVCPVNSLIIWYMHNSNSKNKYFAGWALGALVATFLHQPLVPSKFITNSCGQSIIHLCLSWLACWWRSHTQLFWYFPAIRAAKGAEYKGLGFCLPLSTLQTWRRPPRSTFQSNQALYEAGKFHIAVSIVSHLLSLRRSFLLCTLILLKNRATTIARVETWSFLESFRYL